MRITRQAETITFVLDRSERDLLVFLLRRYPTLDPAYHQIASPEHGEALAAEQQMLTEHMTSEQLSHRQRRDEFIKKRLSLAEPLPEDPDATLNVIITMEDADWLLQLVNNVRVGSWVRLGRPEDYESRAVALSAGKLEDYLSLELGSDVEFLLLRALAARPA